MESQPPTELQEPIDVAYLCSECITGVMHMRALTYFTWLNAELVTVQNFPAWVCDRCGRREWDERAINWLNTLLNPATGRRGQKRRGHLPAMDQPRP